MGLVLFTFLADLKQPGLKVTEEPLIPGVVPGTCRRKPRNLQ